MSGYYLHPEAFADIDEIGVDIGHGSAEAAHSVVNEIYRTIERLVSFPYQGHRRRDLTSGPAKTISLALQTVRKEGKAAYDRYVKIEP